MTTIDIQAPTAPTAEPAKYIPNPNTVSRVTVSQGVTTQETGSGFRSTADAAAAAPAPQATLVSTIKSNWGRPLSGAEIKGDSLIDIGNGMTTTVAAAATMGLIRKGAGGAWEDAQADPAVTPQIPQGTPKAGEGPQDQAPAAIEPLDEAGEGLVSEFMKAGNIDTTAGVRSMLTTGSLSPDLQARAATAMGIPPEQVAEKASALREKFAAQGHASIGPGSENVFAWAQQHRAAELNKAALAQVNNGSTAGYKELARQYIEEMPKHSLDAIRNSVDFAERDIKIDRAGNVTLNIPGAGRVSWQVAVRTGLIAPKLGDTSSVPAQAPGNRQPSQVDVDYLRANPTSLPHFENHFGKGSARRYLA
jgi:hypothetical protein